MIAKYKADPAFTSKSPKTKEEYARYLNLIEAKFGKLPTAALADPRSRGRFKEWRATMADKPAKADYAWRVLALLMAFGKDRGMILTNSCERGGRLYKAY